MQTDRQEGIQREKFLLLKHPQKNNPANITKQLFIPYRKVTNRRKHIIVMKPPNILKHIWSLIEMLLNLLNILFQFENSRFPLLGIYLGLQYKSTKWSYILQNPWKSTGCFQDHTVSTFGTLDEILGVFLDVHQMKLLGFFPHDHTNEI